MSSLLGKLASKIGLTTAKKAIPGATKSAEQKLIQRVATVATSDSPATVYSSTSMIRWGIVIVIILFFIAVSIWRFGFYTETFDTSNRIFGVIPRTEHMDTHDLIDTSNRMDTHDLMDTSNRIFGVIPRVEHMDTITDAIADIPDAIADIPNLVADIPSMVANIPSMIAGLPDAIVNLVNPQEHMTSYPCVPHLIDDKEAYQCVMKGSSFMRSGRSPEEMQQYNDAMGW